MSEIHTHHGAGATVGTEVAGHVDRHSANYCASERQRIETVNRPAILALRARVCQLREQEKDIQERLYHAPPPGVTSIRKFRVAFRYAIAVLLTAAAFIFSVLAFDPFRLGWKSWIYCLGISIVTPFLVDRILERWASPRLVNLLATAAGVVAIVSLILLGEIRGDLMAQQVTSAPSAVIDSSEDAGAPTVPENSFYDQTRGLLRLVMALLAFAIEIGAGIALHEASQLHSATDESAIVLRRELAAIQEQMIIHGHEVWALENAGAAFEHEFWRDFYHSLLNGVKRGSLRTLPLVVTFILSTLAHGETSAGNRLDTVVLLDLSKSVAVKGGDSREEFDKNVKSVTSILTTLPAGARLTVIGITDHSFATPYIIFSGALSDDAGYFGERLAEGHLVLARAWKRRSADLAPVCDQTDIVGALRVASEVFRDGGSNRRKVLVVLSDMRQATPGLNLERQSRVMPSASLQAVLDQSSLADLQGIDVYIEGVDGAGRSLAYWKSLQNFWLAYFARAGATVRRYSVLRDVPEFTTLTSEADRRGR